MSHPSGSPFHYRPPNPVQIKYYAACRVGIRQCAELLDRLLPDSTEKETAIARLTEALYWADAAIKATIEDHPVHSDRLRDAVRGDVDF